MDTIFTKEDKEVIKKYMKTTGYDSEVDMEKRGMSFHAQDDAASSIVPFSELSEKAQKKMIDAYSRQYGDDVHDISHLRFSWNDEWGNFVSVCSDEEEASGQLLGVDLNYDSVMDELYEYACQQNKNHVKKEYDNYLFERSYDIDNLKDLRRDLKKPGWVLVGTHFADGDEFRPHIFYVESYTDSQEVVANLDDAAFQITKKFDTFEDALNVSKVFFKLEPTVDDPENFLGLREDEIVFENVSKSNIVDLGSGDKVVKLLGKDDVIFMVVSDKFVDDVSGTKVNVSFPIDKRSVLAKIGSEGTFELRDARNLLNIHKSNLKEVEENNNKVQIGDFQQEEDVIFSK